MVQISKSKVEKIETIYKRFKRQRQWLMIEIKKTDPKTSKILTGRLLAHSPDRDEILQASIPYKTHIFIDCSRHDLPKGYAYAL